jgi:hypothetical protein
MEYTRTEIRTGLLIVLAAALAAVVIFWGTEPLHADLHQASFETAGLAVLRVRYASVASVSALHPAHETAAAGGSISRAGRRHSEGAGRDQDVGFRRALRGSSRRRGSPLLEEGGRIQGKTTAQLEDMGPLFEDLLANVRETRAQVDSLLGDETFRSDLKEAVKRASDLTEELKGVLSENRAELKQTMRHARSASGEVDSLLRERRDEISSAIEDLASIADKMDRTADDLDGLAKKSRGIVDRNESNIEAVTDPLTARNVRDLSSTLKRSPHKLIWSFPNPFHRDKEEESQAPSPLPAPQAAPAPQVAPAARPAGSPP